MRTLIIRIITNALGLYLSAYLINGISYRGGWVTLLIAGALLGIVNFFIKPLVTVFSLPLILVTFGAFILVINAILLLLVAALIPAFSIQTFGAALLAVLILFVINTVISWIFDTGSQNNRTQSTAQ